MKIFLQKAEFFIITIIIPEKKKFYDKKERASFLTKKWQGIKIKIFYSYSKVTKFWKVIGITLR